MLMEVGGVWELYVFFQFRCEPKTPLKRQSLFKQTNKIIPNWSIKRKYKNNYSITYNWSKRKRKNNNGAEKILIMTDDKLKL